MAQKRAWFVFKSTPLCYAFFCAHLAIATQTPSSRNDFTWLLSYSNKSTNTVIWDKRFRSFLAEVTPRVKLDLGMGRPYSLKDTVQEFIGGPPDEVSVQENRYVTLSACRAHFCPEKAWLWCDTQGHAVVGAIVHYTFQGKYSKTPSLILFSKQLTFSSVPDACKKRLEVWLHQNRIDIEARRFVDGSGTVKELGKKGTGISR